MLTTRTFIFMSLKKTSPLNSRRCFSTNLHVQQTLRDTTTVTSIRVGARRTPLVSSEEVKTSHDKNYWHEKISNSNSISKPKWQSQYPPGNQDTSDHFKDYFPFPKVGCGFVPWRVSQNCLVRKNCNFATLTFKIWAMHTKLEEAIATARRPQFEWRGKCFCLYALSLLAF